MTDAEFAAVLGRFPELKADGWQNHLSELRRIAGRILEAERNPTPAVLPPAGLNDDERAAWFDSQYPRRSS